MVKFIVVNMDFERSVSFRFELPENKATEAFLADFHKAKTAISHGRRWQIFYNARKGLLKALKAAKDTKVLEKLEPFQNDPLAIGIMLDELVNKPKAAAED
ncbi:hypothetical protein DP685_16285 [Salmonella enterica subsp. enterica serovar Mikawasima]|nr:hypothetical protein [Salmonella enterica subsp. enterica serovar Mikawasima]